MERSSGRTLAEANAENKRHPAARARPVEREGRNLEAIEAMQREHEHENQHKPPVRGGSYRRVGPRYQAP